MARPAVIDSSGSVPICSTHRLQASREDLAMSPPTTAPLSLALCPDGRATTATTQAPPTEGFSRRDILKMSRDTPVALLGMTKLKDRPNTDR